MTSFVFFSALVKGLIRSTTGVILAADYTYTSANNDTNTTDGAFNQTRRDVGDVMEAAVAVIDTVSDALLNFVEVGDPAAEVVTDDVTLRVGLAEVVTILGMGRVTSSFAEV